MAAQLDNADEASVQLLSSIGMPVDQPQLVNVEIVQDGPLSTADKNKVKQIIAKQCAGIRDLSQQLIDGKIPVF